MSILRISSDLAAKDPKWSIIRSNFAASLEAGLVDLRQIVSFACRFDCQEVLSNYCDPSRDSTADIQELWSRHVRKIRFSGPGNLVSEKRVRALNDAFPCAHLDAISLSGTSIYRVVSHTNWFELLGSANEFWRRDSVADLDLQGTFANLAPDQLAAWCSAIGSLPEDERRFRLDPGANKSLALGVVWFTEEETVPFGWSEPPSVELAERARDALGLGHFPSDTVPGPTHLFALRFDGAVADRVSHYRPNAIDGLDNARFMVPKNHQDDSQEVNWGWTAHLARIEDDRLSLDGAHERIANQIWEEDMQDAPIDFAYLGELATRHSVPDATFATRLEML
ncbi:hypothetical protein [Ruegeria sp. PrR005]|uniref:Uncharacterized protein n=1 Tax=Ruegeria sp. PrR005 TaxID=2706882 RepID=A0A6B2NUG4_9RHOB|nr:hypothetical protein [Ruegeria sp. PrR005]NDW46353.1 hypothetical protein [Ruegeria sp. PrR005]